MVGTPILSYGQVDVRTLILDWARRCATVTIYVYWIRLLVRRRATGRTLILASLFKSCHICFVVYGFFESNTVLTRHLLHTADANCCAARFITLVPVYKIYQQASVTRPT